MSLLDPSKNCNKKYNYQLQFLDTDKLITNAESIFYHTHISLSRVQEVSICLLTINLSVKQEPWNFG